MKISITQYDTTHSVENTHDDLNIYEVMDMFYPLLALAGFSKELIEKVEYDSDEC